MIEVRENKITAEKVENQVPSPTKEIPPYQIDRNPEKVGKVEKSRKKSRSQEVEEGNREMKIHGYAGQVWYVTYVTCITNLTRDWDSRDESPPKSFRVAIALPRGGRVERESSSIDAVDAGLFNLGQARLSGRMIINK